MNFHCILLQHYFDVSRFAKLYLSTIVKKKHPIDRIRLNCSPQKYQIQMIKLELDKEEFSTKFHVNPQAG